MTSSALPRPMCRLLLACLVLAQVGCGGEEASSAGDGARAWTLTPEPLLRIGALDGPAEELFERISAVRLLDEGRVAVADLGSRSIRIFDGSGAFQVELGRGGQGPGEFEWIGHVEPVGADTLVVYDPALYRFTHLRRDGRVLSTTPVQAPGGAPEIVLGRYTDGGWALAWIDQEAMDRDPTTARADPMVVGRFEADGSLLGIVGRGTGLVRMRLGEGLAGPVPLSPSFQGLLVRDSVVLAGPDTALLVLGDSGSAARSLPLPWARTDPGSARSALLAELERRDRGERARAIGDEAWSTPVPAVAALVPGEEHRIWAKRYEPSTDSWMLGALSRPPGGSWAVLDPDGSVEATVELPDGFILMEVAGDRVAGVSVDSLGVERVEVYGLRR